jgi:hypothetical protein
VRAMDPSLRLLLKRRRRSADSLPLQVDTNLNSVRYPDERNAAIHAVVLAIKGHGPENDEGLPLPESVSFSFSFLVTPRIVKSPSSSKVSGPVCVIFVDLNVMYGSSLTLKKSLPRNFPFLRPLPVSTLSASILMSNTPVESSLD